MVLKQSQIEALTQAGWMNPEDADLMKRKADEATAIAGQLDPNLLQRGEDLRVAGPGGAANVAPPKKELVLEDQTVTDAPKYKLKQDDTGQPILMSQDPRPPSTRVVTNEEKVAMGLSGQPIVQRVENKPAEPMLVEQQPAQPTTAVTGGVAAPSPMQNFRTAIKENADAQSKSLDVTRRIIETARDSGIVRANEEAAHQDQLAKNVDELEAKRTQEKQAQDTAINAKMGEIDQATEDYRKMKPDANRLWASRNEEQKLAMNIGMIFGGWGGGPNQAVEAINNAINRDIASQNALIDKAGNVVQFKRGALHDMQKTFGDKDIANMTTRNMMIDNAKQRILATAASYGSDDARNKADMAIEELNRSQANLKVQMAQSLAASYATRGTGAAQKDMLKETREYNTALESAGVNQGEATIQHLKNLLDNNPGKDDEQLEGIGPQSMFQRGKVKWNETITPGSGESAYSDQAQANRMLLAQFDLDYGHWKSGAALSAADDKAVLALRAVGTRKSLRQAYEIINNANERRREDVAGGYDPAAVALREGRRKYYTQQRTGAAPQQQPAQALTIKPRR